MLSSCAKQTKTLALLSSWASCTHWHSVYNADDRKLKPTCCSLANLTRLLIADSMSFLCLDENTINDRISCRSSESPKFFWISCLWNNNQDQKTERGQIGWRTANASCTHTFRNFSAILFDTSCVLSLFSSSNWLWNTSPPTISLSGLISKLAALNSASWPNSRSFLDAINSRIASSVNPKW